MEGEGGTDRFGSTLAQERLDVTAFEEFEDDVARMSIETDSDETNDVLVRKLAHDERFHQEIHFRLLRAERGQSLKTIQASYKFLNVRISWRMKLTLTATRPDNESSFDSARRPSYTSPNAPFPSALWYKKVDVSNNVSTLQQKLRVWRQEIP